MLAAGEHRKSPVARLDAEAVSLGAPDEFARVVVDPIEDLLRLRGDPIADVLRDLRRGIFQNDARLFGERDRGVQARDFEIERRLLLLRGGEFTDALLLAIEFTFHAGEFGFARRVGGCRLLQILASGGERGGVAILARGSERGVRVRHVFLQRIERRLRLRERFFARRKIIRLRLFREESAMPARVGFLRRVQAARFRIEIAKRGDHALQSLDLHLTRGGGQRALLRRFRFRRRAFAEPRDFLRERVDGLRLRVQFRAFRRQSSRGGLAAGKIGPRGFEFTAERRERVFKSGHVRLHFGGVELTAGFLQERANTAGDLRELCREGFPLLLRSR